MIIYNLLLLIFLNQNLAQRNFEYQNEISNKQQNFQSSPYFQNSFEYKSDSDNSKSKSNSNYNQNSYYLSQNSLYETTESNKNDFRSTYKSKSGLDNRKHQNFGLSDENEDFSSQLSKGKDFSNPYSNLEINSEKFMKSESRNNKRKLLPQSTTESSYTRYTISSDSREINLWTTISPIYLQSGKSINTSISSIKKESGNYETSFRERNFQMTNSSNSSRVRFSKINSISSNEEKKTIGKNLFEESDSNHSKTKSFSVYPPPTINKYDTNIKKEKKRVSEKRYGEFIRRIFGDKESSESDTEINFRSEHFDGREIVDPGEYPHMTAIGYRRIDETIDWKCGGSLIDEYFVITAAHCTDFSGQKPSEVKIGDINLKVREKSIEPQTFSIQNIYNHPKYNKSSYYNDIALLRLKGRVNFTQFVRPIQLYIKSNIPYNTVFAMGYGSTAFGKAKTNILTDLNLTIVENYECNQKLPKEPETSNGIINSQICAIDKVGSRDTCQGDSGGPLQLNLLRSKRTEYYLIGITSYGLFCGSSKPSVYTRISSFIDWIEETVWPED